MLPMSLTEEENSLAPSLNLKFGSYPPFETNFIVILINDSLKNYWIAHQIQL